MDEMTFTLHNPLTEEEWDIIEDVDFEHTNSIAFHTKHGENVVFVKRKRGRWIYDGDCYICNQCKSAFGWWADSQTSNYCPNCGVYMGGGQNEAD